MEAVTVTNWVISRKSAFLKIHRRLNYYRRLFPAYLSPGKSQLSFWHETPEVNERCQPKELGEYYMPFTEKADYRGRYDSAGIPLLDYQGKLGLQYNPIAIAQYGLGNYNLFLRTKDSERRRKFLTVADWLVTNLEQNPAGLSVWNHHFDWEYRLPQVALVFGIGPRTGHFPIGSSPYRDGSEDLFEQAVRTLAANLHHL